MAQAVNSPSYKYTGCFAGLFGNRIQDTSRNDRLTRILRCIFAEKVAIPTTQPITDQDPNAKYGPNPAQKRKIATQKTQNENRRIQQEAMPDLTSTESTSSVAAETLNSKKEQPQVQPSVNPTNNGELKKSINDLGNTISRKSRVEINNQASELLSEITKLEEKLNSSENKDLADSLKENFRSKLHKLRAKVTGQSQRKPTKIPPTQKQDPKTNPDAQTDKPAAAKNPAQQRNQDPITKNDAQAATLVQVKKSAQPKKHTVTKTVTATEKGPVPTQIYTDTVRSLKYRVAQLNNATGELKTELKNGVISEINGLLEYDLTSAQEAEIRQLVVQIGNF